MKRVLGSSLVSLTLMFCLTASAQSAEIPPTPACQATYKQLYAKYLSELRGDTTASQRAVALRKFSERLADADCVTDAKPLYQYTVEEPFSQQCIDAAAKAQAYIGAKTARLRLITIRYNRDVSRPYIKRKRVLMRQRARLKAMDRRGALVRIDRRLSGLTSAYLTKGEPFWDERSSIIGDDAYGILVTLSELRSLLCIGPELAFSQGPGPGHRFVRKNLLLIVNAYLVPLGFDG